MDMESAYSVAEGIAVVTFQNPAGQQLVGPAA